MLPLFYIFARYRPWRKYASAVLNYWWAYIFLTLFFIPYRVEYRFKPQKGQAYVFCANHTSLMDIITMGLIVNGPHVFVGKDSLCKVPLFGYMFREFHIPVNRESKISAYRALKQAMEALAEGVSVIIYPEGSRSKEIPPRLQEFKDGPFRIAIEQQVPVVPVALLNNWHIFRDSENFLPYWAVGRAVVHPPIDTKDLSIEDLEWLKEEAYRSISQELSPYYQSV